MASPTSAVFGSWPSPITSSMVASGSMSSRGTLRDLHIADGVPYWISIQTDQAGRYAIYRGRTGRPEEILPREFSARSRVHEYGGGAFFVHHGVIFFSHDDDQRLYRLEPGQDPIPLTPEPEKPKGYRFADARLRPDGSWLVAVREDHHREGEPANELVAIPGGGESRPRPIAATADFYSSPRFNADGSTLCWLTWDHPNMPWDGAELWIATFDDDGSLGDPKLVAGGREESIIQPEWGPDGLLYFASDRTGWWNLYRWDGQAVQALCSMEAEFASPPWVFGLCRYDFLSGGRIGCVYTQDGVDRLAVLDVERGELERADLPFTAYSPAHVRSDGNDMLWFVASSPTENQALIEFKTAAGRRRVIHRPQPVEVSEGYLSKPETIAFPTGDGEIAHAIYYPPTNPEHQGTEGERPPLVVKIHGGPTSAAAAQLHLEVQFFTSRGFAVADVNYRGSTGYGRPYRDRLKGQWGVVDVEDCVNAARHLADEGRVDPDRLIIRGGSAGGFVTLAAMAFFDVFSVGASYYGVADAEALVQHTHKFESRYIETMVGPYPDAKEVYLERSPIHHVEGLERPLILFQGDEDAVVSPEQSRSMFRALRDRGVPCAYLEFGGESHGFDRIDSIVRSLEAELYFYREILGIAQTEDLEPVEIENID